MPTRSAVLSRRQSPGAETYTVTVPANETWIVKSIYTFNNTAGPLRTYVDLVDPTVPVNARLFDISLGTLLTHEWSGWAVIDGGDQLVIYAQNAGILTWVNGAKLQGVA